MLNNPEFTKNVKIEFGALRFAVPLVVLFLVVWLGWNSNSAGSWKSQIYKPEQLKAAALFAWLCGFGYLFSIIWGTYLTTNNVLEEIKLKTWDFVRLSSLSPFKILTGKMFGATSVVWVVTALCVMPLIYFTGHLMIPADGVIRPEGITLLILLATIFSWVIISYSLVFILLMSASDPKDRAGMFGVTGAIALLGTALGLSITESFEDFHKMFRYGYEVNEKIIEASFGSIIVEPNVSYMRPADTDDWYGMTFYDLDLTAMMFGFFAFWAFIGAWRVLRQSLLYKDMPWVWLLFIVTTSLFMNGFTIKEEEYFRGLLYWPLLITAATMLLACMNEASDSIRYHSFSQKLAAGRHAEAFREMPLWMISFVLFSVTIIINIFMAGSGKAGIVASMGLSVWVLIVRDLLVFHAISWRPNVRRPILGMVIFMVLMYTLLPSVAGSVSDEGKLLFFPLVADFDPEHRDIVSSVYWLSMAVQISVAAFFFFRAWRRSFVGVKA